MPETMAEVLAQAEDELKAAEERGDVRDQADSLAQLGAMRATQGDFAGASQDLRRACDLYFRLDELQGATATSYGLGLMLSRSPDHLTESKEAFERAHSLAILNHDLEMQCRCLERLAGVCGAMEDRDQAVVYLSILIDKAREVENHSRVQLALRSRAMFFQAMDRVDKAYQDLLAAVEAAEASQDRRLALQVKLELRALEPMVHVEGERVDFADLEAEAEAIGATDLLVQLQLQRAAEALQNDRSEEGLTLAEAARQGALKTNAPIVYVTACMLIAEGRERQGDRAGVIEILLTCKATLDAELGPELGQQVVGVLNSLDTRWGKEGVDQALETYRARLQARMAARGDTP